MKKFPDLDGFFPGARWRFCLGVGGLVRIMGPVEDYVVVRYAGCAPFVRHYRDFLEQFERAQEFDPKLRKRRKA